MDGKEVVQVYVTDNVASVVTQNQFLAGFAKLDLPYVRVHISCVNYRLTYHSSSAGSSQDVAIEIKSEQLAVWTLENKFAVEPGTFNIRVGTSDTTFANATLTVQ